MQLKPFGSKNMFTGRVKKSSYEHPVNGVILGALLVIMGVNTYRFLDLPHPPFSSSVASGLMYFMVIMGVLAGGTSLLDWHRLRKQADEDQS